MLASMLANWSLSGTTLYVEARKRTAAKSSYLRHCAIQRYSAESYNFSLPSP